MLAPDECDSAVSCIYSSEVGELPVGDAGWEDIGVGDSDDNLKVDAAGRAGGNRLCGEGGQ